MVEITIDVKLLGLDPDSIAMGIFADWPVSKQIDFLSLCWDQLGKQMGKEQRDAAMRVARSEEKTMRFLEVYGTKAGIRQAEAQAFPLYTVDKQTNVHASYLQAEDRVHRKQLVELRSKNGYGFLLNKETGDVLNLSGRIVAEAIEYQGPGVGLLIKWSTGKKELLQPRSSLVGWRPPKGWNDPDANPIEDIRAAKHIIEHIYDSPRRPPKPLGAESMNEGYSPSSVRSMSSRKQDGYTTRWMTMVDQTYTVESASPDGEVVQATGLNQEQLDGLKKLPPSYAHNAIRALAKFDAIIENDRAMIPSPEKTADQLREWQKVGTCPECGGAGEIELFVGVSPCSRGCEKP